jgi:hypothetical protein
MPYPLQRNYREAHADLAPLYSMIRAARAGRDYANPKAFSDPQHKLEQLRAVFRADPGLRLAEMRQRFPDLAALDDESRSAASPTITHRDLRDVRRRLEYAASARRRHIETRGLVYSQCSFCGFGHGGPPAGAGTSTCQRCGSSLIPDPRHPLDNWLTTTILNG